MNTYLKQSLGTLFFISLSFSLLHAQSSQSVVNIHMPTVPKAPKVTVKVPKAPISPYINTTGDYKTNEQIVKEATSPKVVKFSNHVAPKLLPTVDSPDKIALVGDVKNGQVTAYLLAPYLHASDVVKKLKSLGFSVVTTYKVDKKGRIESVVFTNEELQKLAAKKSRGFAATLRVTIDNKEKLISITNPLYILSAFMQDDYDAKVAQELLEKIRNGFEGIKNSHEELKFAMLKRYQFMAGMPKYQDMRVIKELPNETLLKNAKKSKKIVFTLPLANGATLLGVKLSKRTSKFIKKTGYQNAGLLPYPVLVEDNKAKILDPKYYIAIMYPMLKMSQFMKIATVPGAIEKDVDRVFR